MLITEDISGLVKSAAIHHETCLIGRRIENAHGLVKRVSDSTDVSKVVAPMLLIIVVIVDWVV